MGRSESRCPALSVLTLNQRRTLEKYFSDWGELLLPALVPGAHVLVASNPTLSSHVFHGLLEASLEPRGTIMRVYHGFRGGDRPKNAEREFPDLCVSPRGNYEPWLLFRKPLSEKTVAQNLRKWGAGALKMLDGNRPIPDVIPSTKTPRIEKQLAAHPALKPQRILRLFCRMLMPRPGLLLDPFMGAGSTIAACDAVQVESIGLERDPHYFSLAETAIPRLAALYPQDKGERIDTKPLLSAPPDPAQGLLLEGLERT